MADPKFSLDPNDYEDVEIDDPDNPEWTEEDFAKARPLREALPELYAGLVAEKGRPFKAVAIRDIELTLPSDLFEAFRAVEPLWRVRMETLLEAALRRDLASRSAKKSA
jgi:uncharacterized protein (DUF4415 family)